MAAELAIETRHLYKTFQNTNALENVSLSVPTGSVFGLIGANGAGKSTLIQILLGIIRPSSGRCCILNHQINQDSFRIREKVAFVPDIPIFYSRFTVKQMYELSKRLYPDWDQKRCIELHKSLDMPLRKRVGTLSRGQKVRLALVIALSIRPQLLILDEPTAGLDPLARRQFLKMVSDEAATNNTTMFYSTHNLNDLEQTANHIAALDYGRLIFSSSLNELKTSLSSFQIIFNGEFPPELIQIEEIVDIETSGRLHTVIVSGDATTVVASIRDFNPILLEPMEMSLEDIFIAFIKNKGLDALSLFD